MKKSTFILGSIVLLASCTSTISTVSPAHLDEEVQLVSQRMEGMGYGLSGKSSEEMNEIYVTDAIDNGSEMKNDYYWYDTYLFADSLGNTASYQLKYKLASDRHSAPYVQKISIVGCECSNSKDYPRICGDNGAVQALSTITPDQSSTLRNEKATFWWLTGSLFGAFALGISLLVL